MTETQEATARVARLFDDLAPDYDRSGVDFFGPIARRLVELLEVRPGGRALDLGCGRGAVTLPLAAAVGGAGRVMAVDISPAMVSLTRSVAPANVVVACADAAAPDLPERSFDVVASSLVLFFLPDPASALTRWLRLVAPGGRIGVTTFGPQDEVWNAVDDLFAPYLPPAMLDPRTAGTRGPFASDAAMEALFRECGATSVRTVSEDLPVVFADAEAWRAFSMSVGQRAMWRHVPESGRERLFADAAALLERARGVDGRITLHQQVRYTLAEG
jgi:ubiquinone/menaquinone biosynthesis C-methylase UbiE